MRSVVVFLIAAVFAILACRVALSQEQRSARMQEARELMRRLRGVNQDLREAITQARQSDEVRKALAKVGELRRALRRAQQHADEVTEKVIAEKDADLRGKVAERKALRKKLQELRGQLTPAERRSPGLVYREPDAPPPPPVERPPTQDQARRIIPTIVHFDVPVDDVERARKFYSELFGWKFEKMPGPMEYWLISVTEDEDARAIDGGLMKRRPPEPGWRNYIAVPSVDEYAAKVEKLGGRVVLPKMAVPGFGYFAVCLDTENNCFAVWETDESAK